MNIGIYEEKKNSYDQYDFVILTIVLARRNI